MISKINFQPSGKMISQYSLLLTDLLREENLVCRLLILDLGICSIFLVIGFMKYIILRLIVKLLLMQCPGPRTRKRRRARARATRRRATRTRGQTTSTSTRIRTMQNLSRARARTRPR